MRVLLVDDHAVVRSGMRTILEDHVPAVQVEEAANGDTGLERLAAMAFDVVVLDLSMPGRSGIDLLTEIKHRYPKLTAQASAEISGFAEIGACLHAGFAEVPPVVRLAWAEILSEFDRPADLSNLAGLPRWGDLPRQERKNLQALVDHLFSRIDRGNAKARDFVNDLVRVAMLLAAHSPLSRLIPARLVQEAPARIGSRLVLTVDTREARKGMVALIRDAKDRLISKAVIDDIGDGQVGARIISTFVQVSTIVPSMRIELTAQVKKLV